MIGQHRHIVISADGHAFGPGNGSMDTEQLDLLTEYFEPKYRPEYREYSKQLKEGFEERMARVIAGLFDTEAASSFAGQEAVSRGGTKGLFDSDRRLKELEEEGIVAEVLFPNSVPFGRGFGDAYPPRSARRALVHTTDGWRTSVAKRRVAGRGWQS